VLVSCAEAAIGLVVLVDFVGLGVCLVVFTQCDGFRCACGGCRVVCRKL